MLSVSFVGNARGGPPFVTDDPEPVDYQVRERQPRTPKAFASKSVREQGFLVLRAKGAERTIGAEIGG